MATKKISNLTSLGAIPASGDELPIVDTSASATKKVTTANLAKLQAAYDYNKQPSITDTLSSGGDVMVTWQPTLKMTSGNAGVAHRINPQIDGTDVNWVGSRVDVDITNETVSGSPTRKMQQWRQISSGTATEQGFIDAEGRHKGPSLSEVSTNTDPAFGFIGQGNKGMRDGSGTTLILQSQNRNADYFLEESSNRHRFRLGTNDRAYISETSTDGDVALAISRRTSGSWGSPERWSQAGLDINGQMLVGPSVSGDVSLNTNSNELFPATDNNDKLGKSGNRWSELHTLAVHNESGGISLVANGTSERAQISETGSPSSGDTTLILYRHDGSSWVSKRVHTISGDTVDANDNVLVTDSG